MMLIFQMRKLRLRDLIKVTQLSTYKVKHKPRATTVLKLCIFRLHGRTNGDLQEGSHQGAPPGTAAASAPSPAASHCRPPPPQENLQHEQVGLFRSPVRSLLLSSGSWCMQDFVCAL